MRLSLPNLMFQPMELFVGPLPHQITYSQFRHHFQGFEKHMQVDIRRMVHEGRVLTYALVTTSSGRIGKKLMAKFNGKVLQSSPIIIRPFVHRASGNERRSVKWREQPWKFFNRRRDNERRHYRQLTGVEYGLLMQGPRVETEGEKKRRIA